jgi:predicted nucleotidyltransferase
MYSLLSQPNPKVVENILSIIYYTSKNRKFFLPPYSCRCIETHQLSSHQTTADMKKFVLDDARKLIPFLRSPNPKVRHYAGGALINSALSM